MLLQTSDKVSSFTKPLIKKGFYPMQLVGVKIFADKDGNPIEKKFGHQLIFDFDVYHGNPETGAPGKRVVFKPDDEYKESMEVTLSMFRYYENKDEKTGEWQPAITPNSKITKTLKILGWEFDGKKDVDPEKLVGIWVEGLVDDYTNDKGTMSILKDINPYKGPTPKDSNGASATPGNPKEIVQSEEPINDELENKKSELKKMLDSGDISDATYKKSLDDLNKKV